MPVSHHNDFLDSHSGRCVAMVDELQLNILKTSYTFMDHEEYRRILESSPQRGMKTYWQEILFRAHMSAVIAVLRSRRWPTCPGSRAAGKQLAGLRSELCVVSSSPLRTPQPASEPFHLVSLKSTPRSGRPLVNSASATESLFCSALEDALIHFSHARHVPKQERDAVPPSHHARTRPETIGRSRKTGVFATRCLAIALWAISRIRGALSEPHVAGTYREHRPPL